MDILDFSTLVQNQIDAIKARVQAVLDFSIGSILLALVESNSSVVIWLATLILELLARTRAATSEGSDLDSWMADFAVFREAAKSATGVVTFARFTSTQTASVPVGYSVETFDSTQSFTVTQDETHPNYDSQSNSYILAAGVSSVDLPVEAVNAGIGGNVLAGTITILTQSIVGIDTVTNAVDFVNGADAQSDEDFRAYFVMYILSLAKAAKNAIEYAIVSVGSYIRYVLVENEDVNGNPNKGFFYAVIDDGTGYPSEELISSVYNAINSVRAFTITFNVYPPTVRTATITLTLPGASSAVKQAVKEAIVSKVNDLGLGVQLPYTFIAKIAYDTDSSITNVTNITLNGGTSDLTCTSIQVVKTDISNVTVS